VDSLRQRQPDSRSPGVPRGPDPGLTVVVLGPMDGTEISVHRVTSKLTLGVRFCRHLPWLEERIQADETDILRCNHTDDWLKKMAAHAQSRALGIATQH